MEPNVILEVDRTAVAINSYVRLKARIVPDTEGYGVDVTATGGDLTKSGKLGWRWRSDEPGEFTVTATLTRRDDRIVGKQSQQTIYVVAELDDFYLDVEPDTVPEGRVVTLTPEGVSVAQDIGVRVKWHGEGLLKIEPADAPLSSPVATADTSGLREGSYTATATLVGRDGNELLIPAGDGKTKPLTASEEVDITPRPLSRGDVVPVALQRSSVPRTRDQALWAAIRNRTRAISFSGSGHKDFIDRVLCRRPEGLTDQEKVLADKALELDKQVYGVSAYELLRTATEIFLLTEAGIVIDEALINEDEEAGRIGERLSIDDLKGRLTEYLGQRGLPYLDRVIQAAFPGLERKGVFCHGIIGARVQRPLLLELIWSYWHEEGMLVQTMNAISRRFQNVRGPGDRDPLAHLEIDPLRPLNNLLWGYIQEEQNLLTVRRRAYEYDHHYGLTIYGKAVPALRPADSRSKFIEAFHNLLNLTSVFYKEDNDTTVIAEGFPLLNALREVHLLLAQGAHNQFGDLPWTARVEMLTQQWLLARPEMREFLQSRPMVPYKEGWMGQVDTMKTLQGWSDVTVTHFRDLGVYGEQILLSIRYGDWIDVNDENASKNWARYWRPEIQAYLHAYRAVTGVDLANTESVDYAMPAIHLQKRLATQRAR
jgi:hypothetical protein